VALVGVAAVLALLLVLTVLQQRSVIGGLAAVTVAVTAAVVAWAAVVSRRSFRGSIPWIPIALTCTALADLAAQVVERGTGTVYSVSVSDLLRLAGIAALGGMLLLPRLGGSRLPRASLQSLLDGGAALVVALLVTYQSGAAALLADRGHDLLDQVLWLTYPVLDAVVIGLGAWRVVVGGRVRWPALLGLLAAGCWLAADIGRLATMATGTDSSWPRVAHLVGMLLLALAPWARVTPGDRDRGRRSGHGPWRMTLNVLPFTAPALVELAAWQRGVDVNPAPGLGVWGVLLVLTTIRTRVLALDADRAWAAVRSQARRSEALAVHSSDAVAVVDGTGLLTSDSRTLTELLGRPATSGVSLPDLLTSIGVAPDQVTAALLRAQREPGAPVELDLLGGGAATGPVWLGGRAVDLRHDPDVAGIVVSVYDITARKLAERELAHQAFYDGLTGLANRSLFLDHAEQALRRAGRTGSAPIMLCLDLDGFKDVNDSIGHLAGDELLCAVAERLRGVVRSADTVARLGGDEFAVLVDDTTGGLPAAAALAQRLLEVISEPVDLGGHTVTVAASIGIVVAEPEATPLSLFRDADIAMYRAKAAGRAQWVVFDPEMRTAALQRIELERELAGALAAGQLRLAYQPVVDLRTEQVTGFEALLRWQHPTLGAVGPDRFVPVAEDSGEIVAIGRWVLAQATATAARWQRAHPGRRLSMAVNVSARQLVGGTLLQHVAEALTTSGLAPSALVLEVTETALVTDPAAVAERLAELRSLGVRLALDDFGTGYSSLSYLRQFDVDVLKIDRSFVTLLDGSPDDAAIVHGLVQLGRTLRLEVVAEGVETTGQRDRLQAERCDSAQGYLFSAPLEEADAELLLLEAPAPLVVRT
jgi:diguanylate cyclase (GGDEF)-like protein